MNKPKKRPPNAPQKRPYGSSPKLPFDEIERRRALARASAEERKKAEAKRAALIARMKEEKKKRRAFLFKLFLFRFLVYLIILALMLGIAATVFFISLNRVDKVNDDDFTYIIATEKKRTVPYHQMMRGDIMYVNFSEIAEKFGMAVTGSYESFKFVSDFNDEYVRFTPGDTLAYVNGNRIYLTGAPILEDKDLWIPLDFITEHMDGVSVKYNDEERTLSVKQLSYGAEAKAITFKYKSTFAIPGIPEIE